MLTEYKYIYIAVNKHVCLSRYKTACSIPKMKYGERLKAAREHAKITQQQLADRIRNIVTQAAISYLENSDATGSEYTVQFALACEINPAWLASEQGNMLESAYKVHDPRLIHAVKVMEALPAYALDTQIQGIDSLAELLARAKANGEPKK